MKKGKISDFISKGAMIVMFPTSEPAQYVVECHIRFGVMDIIVYRNYRNTVKFANCRSFLWKSSTLLSAILTYKGALIIADVVTNLCFGRISISWDISNCQSEHLLSFRFCQIIHSVIIICAFAIRIVGFEISIRITRWERCVFMSKDLGRSV